MSEQSDHEEAHRAENAREHTRALRASLIRRGVIVPADEVPDLRGETIAATMPVFRLHPDEEA